MAKVGEVLKAEGVVRVGRKYYSMAVDEDEILGQSYTVSVMPAV